MTAVNVGATIAPKSDQLNADDLIAGPITVRIVSVAANSTDSGPIRINIEGRLPYYPCKGMRRVLVAAWGEDGAPYAGRYMTLYRDPEVKYGGIKVGGIRISHLSDIGADMYMALTVTRGKRAEYTVQRLNIQAPAAKAAKPKSAPVADGYPADQFETDLPRMHAAIASGRSTFAQVIAHAEKTGPLSDEQKHRIATLPTEQ